MVIMAALFGIGVGAFRSVARPERIAGQQLLDALRTTRLLARGSGEAASLLVFPAEGTLVTLSMAAVGNWHFEDDQGSGWPFDAQHPLAARVPSPVLGTALELSGEATLVLPAPPASFDAPAGFGLEVWLQPAAGPRPMTLLERPGLWSLALTEADVLEITLWLQPDTDDPGQASGTVFRHEVPTAPLLPDRMRCLELAFDGRTLRVAVDGRRVEPDTRFPEPRRLARAPHAAILSGTAPHQYRGLLDELRLSVAVAGDPVLLPEEVQLEGGDQVLRLDASGQPDPAWHSAPFRIGFVHGAVPRRTLVECGLLGTLQTWEEPLSAGGAAGAGSPAANGSDASTGSDAEAGGRTDRDAEAPR